METKQRTAFKHRLLNMCVLVFVGVLTAAVMVTFFVALFTDGNNYAYSIASIYILCMLLAAPTLKVFLDKVDCCKTMRFFNIVGLISIFTTMMVLTVAVCIDLVL